MQNNDFSKFTIAGMTAKPVLMDETEVANYLCLSPQVLQLWRQKRKQGLDAPVLPFAQLGRSIKFRKTNEEKFLLESMQNG